jgi:hypothetical protein
LEGAGRIYVVALRVHTKTTVTPACVLLFLDIRLILQSSLLLVEKEGTILVRLVARVEFRYNKTTKGLYSTVVMRVLMLYGSLGLIKQSLDVQFDVSQARCAGDVQH